MIIFLLIRSSKLNALAHVCPYLRHRIKSSEDFVNESIYETIQDVSPKLPDLIQFCSQEYLNIKCSEIVKPVFSDEGLCFTFNALNSHDIYTDE